MTGSINAIQTVKAVILGVLVALSMTFAYAQWTPPSAPPTGGNPESPIQPNDISQNKLGGLTVGGVLPAGLANMRVIGTAQNTGSTGAFLGGVVTGNLHVGGSSLSLNEALVVEGSGSIDAVSHSSAGQLLPVCAQQDGTVISC